MKRTHTLTLGSLLLAASAAWPLALIAAEEPVQPPTLADVSYGPDTKQVMDEISFLKAMLLKNGKK